MHLLLVAVLLLPTTPTVVARHPGAVVHLAAAAPPNATTAGYGSPLAPPVVVRRFDPPPQPWLAGHRGVDLAAEPGAVVRAAGPGTIVYAGRLAGRGVVSIRHPGGLRTSYEPVDIEPARRAGDPVRAAEPIGVLAAGHPGCPAAACLHWGLRRGEQYLDPLLLLGLGRVRLLPLGGELVALRQGSAGGRVLRS